MEEQKIMSPQIKGIIISLIIIVIGLAGYFTDLAYQPWFNWATNGIFVIAIIFACIHFAKEKEGYVTFGNVFLHGFKVSAVVTIFLLLYTILAFTVLFPEMKDKIFEMQRAAMEEQGVSEDQIETGMGFAEKYFMIFLVLGVIFGNLVFGAIASLIGAGVAKKKPVNPLA